MDKLLKAISNLIAIIYGILYIPIILMILIFAPIKGIADGVKIIQTGYTVTNDYISLIIAILILTYISLRFRNLRKMYVVFPALFETIKFLTITNLFVALGVEFINWSYITLNTGRHRFGIIIFIISLILWRVFISVYYSKNPIADFMLRDEEKMQNYSEGI